MESLNSNLRVSPAFITRLTRVVDSGSVLAREVLDAFHSPNLSEEWNGVYDYQVHVSQIGDLNTTWVTLSQRYFDDNGKIGEPNTISFATFYARIHGCMDDRGRSEAMLAQYLFEYNDVVSIEVRDDAEAYEEAFDFNNLPVAEYPCDHRGRLNKVCLLPKDAQAYAKMCAEFFTKVVRTRIMLIRNGKGALLGRAIIWSGTLYEDHICGEMEKHDNVQFLARPACVSPELLGIVLEYARYHKDELNLDLAFGSAYTHIQSLHRDRYPYTQEPNLGDVRFRVDMNIRPDYLGGLPPLGQVAYVVVTPDNIFLSTCTKWYHEFEVYRCSDPQTGTYVRFTYVPGTACPECGDDDEFVGGMCSSCLDKYCTKTLFGPLLNTAPKKHPVWGSLPEYCFYPDGTLKSWVPSYIFRKRLNTPIVKIYTLYSESRSPEELACV